MTIYFGYTHTTIGANKKMPVNILNFVHILIYTLKIFLNHSIYNILYKLSKLDNLEFVLFWQFENLNIFRQYFCNCFCLILFIHCYMRVLSVWTRCIQHDMTWKYQIVAHPGSDYIDIFESSGLNYSIVF